MRINAIRVVPLALALVIAVLMTSGTTESSYEEQLLRLQIRQEADILGPEIEYQPPIIQALLLDYLDDPALVLATRLALLRQPGNSKRIFPLYGDEPEFRQVLLRYGDQTLPVIRHFMDTPIVTLEWRRAFGERYERMKVVVAGLFGKAAGSVDERDHASPRHISAGPTQELTPEERGWYAIHFLSEEGYDFLGQFSIDASGQVQWVQSERVLEAMASIFLGGVRRLETRWRQGQEIFSEDLAWATLDVVAIAASVKLLKAFGSLSAVAKTTQTASLSTRTALIGSRLLARSGQLGISIAKVGAVPAAIYLMFRYPALMNPTLAAMADWVGISPWLLQFMFWFFAMLSLLWLSAYILKPIGLLFRGLAWILYRLDGWIRPRRMLLVQGGSWVKAHQSG